MKRHSHDCIGVHRLEVSWSCDMLISQFAVNEAKGRWRGTIRAGECFGSWVAGFDGSWAVVRDTSWRLLSFVRQTRVCGNARTNDRATLRDHVLDHKLSALKVLVQHLLLQRDALFGVMSILARYFWGIFKLDTNCCTIFCRSCQVILKYIFLRNGILPLAWNFCSTRNNISRATSGWACEINH